MAKFKNDKLDKAQIESIINRYKISETKREMTTAFRYYIGHHDILHRKRTVIGENGTLKEIDNIPNNKAVDNQYYKAVKQKVNYLLGKPLTFDTKNEKYQEQLQIIFDKKFHKMFKQLGEDVINYGIGWVYVSFDEDGKLLLQRITSSEVIPVWENYELNKLRCAIRMYWTEEYTNKEVKDVEKVEVYYKDRVEHYTVSEENTSECNLIEDINHVKSYIVQKDNEEVVNIFGWDRVPLIPFKYNEKAIPLINRVKILQDKLNEMISDYLNNMQEDSRNTILILKNYEGTDLGEFRHNLASYGAVKVSSRDGYEGGVEVLNMQVNAQNYETIIKILKKAIIENAMSYDGKDDRISGTPNQMNIMSMYSDVDLDGDDMETEMQSSLDELLWFVNVYLANTNKGNYFNEDVRIIFNRDMIMNESESIANCQKSLGILSNETIISQHPWVSDVKKEIERIDNQEKETEEDYGFNNNEEIDDRLNRYLNNNLDDNTSKIPKEEYRF